MGTVMMFLGAYIAFIYAVLGVVLAYAIISYIFFGISMSTVARRRGIRQPWMAWVPFVSAWLLGGISDHYRQATQGIDRNFRKKLLIWTILAQVAMIPADTVSSISSYASTTGVGAVLYIVTLILAVPALAVAVIQTVFWYMAIFDYFRSCTPDKAVLYLMLSLFVPFAYAILVFVVRNKDMGMPVKEEISSVE